MNGLFSPNPLISMKTAKLSVNLVFRLPGIKEKLTDKYSAESFSVEHIPLVDKVRFTDRLLRGEMWHCVGPAREESAMPCSLQHYHACAMEKAAENEGTVIISI